jgi:hypothetical protein
MCKAVQAAADAWADALVRTLAARSSQAEPKATPADPAPASTCGANPFVPPAPADDGLDIPRSLRRTPPVTNGTGTPDDLRADRWTETEAY